MKTRFPSILGVFAAILMVASFVVPMNIAAPSPVSADPGIMKWDTVIVPGSYPAKNDILNDHWPKGADIPKGSEIIDMAVANDGMTVAFVVRTNLGSSDAKFYPITGLYGAAYAAWGNLLFITTNSGIFSSLAKENALFNNADFGYSNLYQVAIAPDDPKFMVVSADVNGIAYGLGVPGLTTTQGPTRLFVSSDGGSNWDLALDGIPAGSGGNEFIREIDISIDYGGKRDIGFVTANGAGAGRWYVRPSGGFMGWLRQADPTSLLNTGISGLDYYAIKFSPTYNGDSSVALVFADSTTATGGATWYNVAYRDLNANTASNYGFPTGLTTPGIEVKSTTANIGDSPGIALLRNVGLQLPSDFSGQSASLRRVYISLEAATKSTAAQTGIYRIDDTTQYVLMDTTTSTTKDIYSIAYFGTYASGKLLAGERYGYPCTATVPTWFTDSPTTCPIPCWYPALKPTTGAAAQGTCSTAGKNGVGAALVGWNADGSLGLVSTGSLPAMNTGYSIAISAPLTWYGWYLPFTNVSPYDGWNVVPNDESAFAISRNNGETWNQISLIDTTVDWFNDVAVAPDCTTIYLASVNQNTGIGCNEFDSVWRATINPNVAAPLPAIPPLGFYWERVFTHVTSGSCNVTQTELPILRVVPSCTDKKDGEIVGWAAQNARATSTLAGAPSGGGVMAWSPDYGDYWAMITPRFAVQDFAFESGTTIYTVNTSGLVQRLPYTGTSWSTNLPSYDTTLQFAHTIVAIPDGKVLVGGAPGSTFPAAYSMDKGVTMNNILDAIVGQGNEHVIFDVDFANNNFIYMGDDGSGGAVGTLYRNTIPSWTRWVDNDMMSVGSGAFAAVIWPVGTSQPPHPVGQFGVAQAWTGNPQPALYSAHDNITNSHGYFDSAVCRTLTPRNGMPKPGIGWDCLDVFAPLNQAGVRFTLEPTSLKFCGCCTLDTNTILYAIDNESTGRWNGHMSTKGGGASPFVTEEKGVYDKYGYTPTYNQGMLWAYTDCLAKKGPVLKSPADKFLVGADPVSGRNQQVDLSWEQLCLSTVYQLQIAKDAAFSLRINPSVNYGSTGGYGVIAAVTGSIMLTMDATNMTSPAAWLAPGTLPEAGAIYYWRIRSYQSATSQYAISPWSEARSFTVKAGFIVNTPYYGVQLLAPNNGCLGCKVKPASFSWSPWKEATKYQFDLATDPEFKSLVVTATTTTTGYEYSGTLNYSTNYFWRVKALEVNGQNIPSDWSATFSMQSEPAPAPPAPPPAEPATPVWVWVIIAIGAILVIVTLVLIFKTRRV